LGYTLDLENLKLLLKATPAGTRFIIDEVNLDLGNSKQLFSLPWKELNKEFPHHHLIFVDSFSKSHNMVPGRVGFGLTTQKEDSKMLRDLEPPIFTNETYIRTAEALFDEPIGDQTRKKIQYFYERLLQIQENSNGQINVGPTLSNFCVVVFKNPQIKANFFEKLKNADAAKIPAKRIIGLPLEGSGQLSKEDLNKDGTLKDETFERKCIIGLSTNAVRLSALNHPFILDALEEVL
jgi:histidinol-phosphate/aromatic aminotransferase/cobyric acid decarboxylase-like protein